MLILREDAPKPYLTVEAIASFRDIVAISAVPLSRAKSAIWGRSFATYYSDWYDFYPWMINLQHQHIVCHTPALSGLETVESLAVNAHQVSAPSRSISGISTMYYSKFF